MSLHEDALRLFITDAGGRTRVDVGGDVDMATAPHLAERLAMITDAGAGDVDLDLSNVTFCDSSGLNVLLVAHRHLLAAGRRIRIIGASDQVARLLALTGADTILGPTQ